MIDAATSHFAVVVGAWAVNPLATWLFDPDIAVRGALVFVAWAVCGDIWHRTPRRWTHWLGIATLTLLAITGGSTFLFR